MKTRSRLSQAILDFRRGLRVIAHCSVYALILVILTGILFFTGWLIYKFFIVKMITIALFVFYMIMLLGENSD